MVLSKKFYLKNNVQGNQKQWNTILFMHILYNGSKNDPAKLLCWVKELINNIFSTLQICCNFYHFRVI